MGYSALLMETYETGTLPDRIRVGTYNLEEFSCRRFLETPPPRTEYLVEDYIPLGVAGTLYSRGGVGKSMLTLDLAIRIAVADVYVVKWLGKFTVQTGGMVFYISAEEPDHVLHMRVNKLAENIAKEINVPYEDFSKLVWQRLMILNVWGKAMTLFEKTSKGIDTTEDYKKFLFTFEDHRPKFVVFDTRGRLSGLDENDNASAGREVAFFEAIASQTKATVMILHHTNKASYTDSTSGSSASRGASAFLDSLRVGIYLQYVDNEKGEKIIKIVNSKQNYGKVQGPVFVKQDGFSFEAVEDPQTKVKTDTLGENIEILVDFVVQNPGLSKNEIYTRLKGSRTKKAIIPLHQTRMALKAAIALEQLAEKDENGKIIITTGKSYGTLTPSPVDLDDESEPEDKIDLPTSLDL